MREDFKCLEVTNSTQEFDWNVSISPQVKLESLTNLLVLYMFWKANNSGKNVPMQVNLVNQMIAQIYNHSMLFCNKLVISIRINVPLTSDNNVNDWHVVQLLWDTTISTLGLCEDLGQQPSVTCRSSPDVPGSYC